MAGCLHAKELPRFHKRRGLHHVHIACSVSGLHVCVSEKQQLGRTDRVQQLQVISYLELVKAEGSGGKLTSTPKLSYFRSSASLRVRSS